MRIKTHTDTALAVARETGWDLDQCAADHEWAAVGMGPVGVHRDSDALANSNWIVVRNDLTGRFGDAVDTVSFGHWGVGWVEELVWDAGREDVAQAVQAWREALADYPVADDEHFCELEYVDSIETIRAVLSSSIERDGERYELGDLPEDHAESIFSRMFDEGSDTSPDGMRGAAIEDAAWELRFYVPES